MNIKNRQDLLKWSAAAMVVLYVLVNWVFSPLQDWWIVRQKQIKTLQSQVSEGKQLIHRETAIRNHWSQMQTNALSPVMSQAEQQFLTAMEGWSRESQAEITSIMPQWKIDSTNYMTLNCRVETGGDLGSLSRFIYEVENGPLAVRVDSIELSAHDASGQQMTLGVEINGLALLQK